MSNALIILRAGAVTALAASVFLASFVVPAAANDMPIGSHADHVMSPGSTQHYAKVGMTAPDFTLDAMVGVERGKEFKKISLTDYRGKWVVLFFYPYDFSFVCPTEIKAFNVALDSFSKLNADVLGASADSKYSHLAWVKRGDLGELRYPLLADFKKEAAVRFGILDEHEGTALRGLFIIDPQGIIQYESVNNLSVGRSVDEVLRILEALQTGELCPINWRPGQKTLGK